MPETIVIVDRPTSGRRARVAAVIEEIDHRNFRVRWSDGAVETLKTDRQYVRSIEGSGRYLSMIEPETLDLLLEDDPAVLFRLALQEASRSVTAAQLRRAVVDYGLDAKKVDLGWGRAQKAFESAASVTRSPKAPPTYAWNGPAEHLPVKAPVADYPKLPSGPSVAGEFSAPPSDSVAVDSRTGQDDYEEPSLAKQHPRGKDNDHSLLTEIAATSSRGDPEASGGTTKAPPAQMVALLNIAIKDPEKATRESTGVNLPFGARALLAWMASRPADASDIGALLDSPLNSAAELGHYSVAAIVKALEYEAALPALLPTLAGLKSRVDLGMDDAIAQWVKTDGAVESLGRAVREFEADPESKHKARSLGRFAELVTERAATTRRGVQELVRFLEVTRRTREGSVVQSCISVVGTLAVAVRKQGDHEIVPAPVRKQIISAIQAMPYAAAGGRSAFVAALGIVAPSEAVLPEVWRGFDLDALRCAGDGVLGNVLRVPAVEQDIVRPIVEGWAATVTSRRSLGVLVSLPGAAAAVVSDQVFSGALRRVAETDRSASRWLNGLSRDSELNALREQLRIMKSEADRARLNATDAEEVLAAERQKAEVLRARLASLVDTGSGLRGHEKRQAQIDGLRASAQMAAIVEQEAGSIPPVALLGRLQGLLARQGITTMAKAGDVAAFDPVRHDAPGTRPLIGADITVVRSGYVVQVGDEDIVLVRAVVDKA